MKSKSRITLEVIGPPLLGTVALFIWKHQEFVQAVGITPRVFLAYLAYAYAFAIVPSIAYTIVMEAWMRRTPARPIGAFSTVALSVLMGSAAGFVIFLASEAPVIGIGAVVGLILGVAVSLPRGDEKANA